MKLTFYGGVSDILDSLTILLIVWFVIVEMLNAEFFSVQSSSLEL